MAEIVHRRDRELVLLIQARVKEGARLAVHLEVADEGIPVRHRAPAGEGVHVDTGQAIRWRDQRRRGLARRRVDHLAIHEHFGVEPARAPGANRPANRAGGDRRWLARLRPCRVQQVCDRLQVRRQADDQTDVQVTIGHAVESRADAVKGDPLGRLQTQVLDG